MQIKLGTPNCTKHIMETTVHFSLYLPHATDPDFSVTEATLVADLEKYLPLIEREIEESQELSGLLNFEGPYGASVEYPDALSSLAHNPCFRVPTLLLEDDLVVTNAATYVGGLEFKQENEMVSIRDATFINGQEVQVVGDKFVPLQDNESQSSRSFVYPKGNLLLSLYHCGIRITQFYRQLAQALPDYKGLPMILAELEEAAIAYQSATKIREIYKQQNGQ